MSLGLTVRKLSKSYGHHLVVKDVSLTVPSGQFVCFLGPSGCGKTTLLRMIAGLETPTSGRIFLDDRDITDTPVHERNFAMVFQALALFPFLTVEQNIGFSLRFRALDAEHRHQIVRSLLTLIKLPDVGARSIQELSGGQRPRVAIARALAQEPTLFLLDEPLSALDAQLRDHMQVELRQLQQKLRVTTILVTHDQREAMTIADTIVIMSEGAIQQIGAPTEIYRRPATRFVAAFIGRSNLLQVTVVDQQHVRLGQTLLRVPVPAGVCAGVTVTLAIRPENVHLLAAEGDAHDSVPAQICFVRDVGEQIELRLDCQGQQIISSASPSEWATRAASDRVSLRLLCEHASILTS